MENGNIIPKYLSRNYVYLSVRTFNGFEPSDGKVRKIMYTVEYEHETIEIVILDDKGYEDDLRI